MKNILIGETLVDYGLITQEQVEQALAYQKEHPSLRLGPVMIELGFVTEAQLLDAVADRAGQRRVDLSTYAVDAKSVELIPRQLAQRYHLIAVSQLNGRLQIVINDPLNFYAVEDVRQITQMSVEVLVDITRHIDDALEFYYAEIEARTAARKANGNAAPEETLDLVGDAEGEEAPVVQVLNSLLVRGYSINASDIHIEPFEKSVSVRMRLDGVISDYVTLAKSLHTPLVARVKILANLDIAERRLPQDGHFKINLNGTEMNVRVSTIPTVYGEKVVIRFLSTQVQVDNFRTFGMSPENYAKFKVMMDSPYGIIYITGPTGSGKTTTLYMVLDALSHRPVNISTIEDPVERNLARINQVQVNAAAGLTFEVGLRSLLRQDPDVIMVGETRDNETASISVRAAITGHQVFSTLHTNDAISSIVRLEDMGVPAFMVANSVVGLVAQRLMRKICPNCAYEYTPEAAETNALGKTLPHLHKGKGCHMCNDTGYKGRIAVHEVVLVDKEIRRMIATSAQTDAILSYCRANQGFRTLRDCALELVEQGITTVEEFNRIAYYAD